MTTERERRLIEQASARMIRRRALGPLATPTETEKSLPKAGPLEKAMVFPTIPRAQHLSAIYQRREAPKPTLGERLSPPSSPSRRALEYGLQGLAIALTPLAKATEAYDKFAAENELPTSDALFLANPGLKVVGGLEQAAIQARLIQAGQAAASGATMGLQKASPVARRLATEEAGAVKLTHAEAPQRITRFTVPKLEAQRVALDAQLEKTGFKMDAVAGLSPDEYFIVIEPPKMSGGALPADAEGFIKGLRSLGASDEAIGKITKVAGEASRRRGTTHVGAKGTTIASPSGGFLYFQNMDDVTKFMQTGDYVPPSIRSRTPLSGTNPQQLYALATQPKAPRARPAPMSRPLTTAQLKASATRQDVLTRASQAYQRIQDSTPGPSQARDKLVQEFEAFPENIKNLVRSMQVTVREAPVTQPAASEALGPAAKPAKATEGTVTRTDFIRKAQQPSKAPVGARRTPQQVSESVAQATEQPRVAPTGAKAAAEQVVPPPSSAAPPAKLPGKPPTIRRVTQPEPSFSVIGMDSQGRKVRAVAPTLKEAQAIRTNILEGKEPFAGAEMQFQQKAVANAERRMKAAVKRGDKGAEQRADVELHELYSTGGKLPPKPPKPPTIGPDGASVPPSSFEGARDKLVKILQTSVRRSSKELESLRAAERKRRAGLVEAGYQRAAAAGEPPIARIRAAQRGEFPTPELELTDRLLPEEVSVLRGSIYDTLGPELRQTAANVDEALTRLATEGKLPTPSELAWMEEIFGQEFVKALLAHRTRGAKALELALGVWNLPRALLASFDDSMVLRQGLHLLPEGAPAGRALKAHIKAITSAGAEEVIEGIRANPWFNHGRARGLDLSLPGVARGLVGREEVFMGAGIAAKIPILGRGIRVSERVAEAYLNKLRMETYAAHAQELTRIGASEAAFRELAQNIGILSGRASLGKAQAIAPVLNGLFFSARLNWARAQAPVRILRQVPNLGTLEGRHLAKMLAKDVYGVWAGIAGMLGVAAAAGAAVELDPRSSDFGKIQIGTVRVDPWAGQQQFAVLMARLVSGEVKTTTTRTIRPQEEMDTLARFIESKFHPALGQLIAVKRGKTYVGEELTVNEYAKQWLPLFVQDIQEITAGTTPGMAAALGIAAFFGVSVYNIPGVPSSVINQLEEAVNAYTAIPADSLELAPGQSTREQFRIVNPRADAALFIAGQVTSLASEAAITEAARLIQQHGINPDDIRGIDQRKERLEQARAARKVLPLTEVDMLIRILASTVSQPRKPTTAPTPVSDTTRLGVPRRQPTPVGAR